MKDKQHNLFYSARIISIDVDLCSINRKIKILSGIIIRLNFQKIIQTVREENWNGTRTAEIFQERV